LTNLDSEYNIKNGIWVNDEVFKIATPNKLIYQKNHPINQFAGLEMATQLWNQKRF
jgi:hypothetical protein